MPTTRTRKSKSPVPSKRRSSATKPKCPDWLPSNVVALLAHQDPGVRATAEDHVVGVAQEIVCSAYFKRLGQLVPPLLPKGVPFPSPNLDGDCPVVRLSEELLAQSRSEIEKRAEEYAEGQAAETARWETESWIGEQDHAFSTEFGDEPGNLTPLLTAALDELKDAKSAYNSASVWYRLMYALNYSSRPPPSWREVDALVREHPDLVTVGPVEMVNRGFLPPPWFTAALAAT